MPQQPFRLPTPLDLARVRPRPAPPPPPRNRRQAEMEKDRARQELRALLADPAAGFAAVSGDEFFAALKRPAGPPAALAVLGGIPVMLGTLAADHSGNRRGPPVRPDPALPHRARMVHHHPAQNPRRLRAGVDPLAPRQDPHRAAHHPSALRRASAPMVPSRNQRHRIHQRTAAADRRLLGPRHPGQRQRTVRAAHHPRRDPASAAQPVPARQRPTPPSNRARSSSTYAPRRDRRPPN